MAKSAHLQTHAPCKSGKASAPQRGSIAGSAAVSGSSQTASDLDTGHPALSSTASGTDSAPDGGPGLSSAASGAQGAELLSRDVSDISFVTALSSAGHCSGPGLHAEGPKPEALHAWASASSRPNGKAASAAPKPAPKAQASRPCGTDLDRFHDEATIEKTLSEGHFTKIRGLSDCCRNDGKVELHRWHEAEHEEDRVVVVKRILTSRVYANKGKEPNERTVHRRRVQRDSEDTLTEIGVYSLLSRQRDLPEYILRMHMVFEAGSDAWLVLEHADGGDLFGVMQQGDCGQGLSQSKLTRWMWQLMHAVNYLHRHHIGHRDISMENVLLRGGVVRLMDFGQAVQTHAEDGTALRYFVPAGKPYYRGPECYVPTEAEIKVVVPSGSRPGQVVFARSACGDYLLEVLLPPAEGPPLPLVPGITTAAEPWGYAAVPSDVFACGVCFFILATGLPPWRQAKPSDGHFAFSYSRGIQQLLQAWERQLPSLELELLTSMLRWDPAKRPSAEECLAHQWFAPLHGTSVPVHCGALASPASPPASPVAEAAPASAPADDLARLIQGLTGGAGGADAGGDAYAWSGHEGEWSELVSQTGVSADYYSRPAVCRGDAAATGEEASTLGLGICLPVQAVGDFYGSQEEEYARTALFGDVDPAISSPPAVLELPSQLGLARAGAGASEGAAPACAERFCDEDVPPEVPQDEDFRFEPMTLHVAGSAPADVGNHLLGFLTTVAGANVTKVNRRKFTIKAAFEGDVGACSLKVRLYSEGGSRHAVEFQRRGGDVLALHLLYQRAVEYLDHLVRALTPEDSRPNSPATQPYDGNEVELSPLLDWADPGVKGLLKRNRRRQDAAPALPGRGQQAGARKLVAAR